MGQNFALKPFAIIVLSIALLVAALAFADTVLEPPKGLPAEAYASCQGKKAGEAVVVKIPNLTNLRQAVCQSLHNRLVAIPVNSGPLFKPGEEQ